MPYVIGRPPKCLVAALTVAGLLLAPAAAVASPGGQTPIVTARPSSPDAACPAVTATPMLSRFGDTALYSPVPGGTFNGPRTRWSLSDAAVVKADDTWDVSGGPSSRSVRLEPGGRATSPAFCLDATFPSFRFFALSADPESGGALDVSVRYTDADGDTEIAPMTTLGGADYGTWTLTPSIALSSALANGTVTAQLIFSASAESSWNIDDVLLDPYAK